MRSLPCIVILLVVLAYPYPSTAGTSAVHPLSEPDYPVADTTLVNQYLRNASKSISSGEPDSADAYFKRAIELSRKLNSYSLEVRSMERHVGFLHRQLRFDEALSLCENILALAKENNDEPRIANTYNNMGVLLQAMGKLHLAAENYIKALDLAEKNAHIENQAKFNSNLASIFVDLKDREKALHYARKGYAIAVEMKDSVRISNSLVNLSVSEIINGNYNDAVQHLNQMISIASRINNLDRVLDGYINLGDIYIKQKQYNTALDVLLKAKQGLRPSTPPDYALYIYNGLAVSYFHLNNLEQARYYYERLFPEIEDSFPRNELKDIYLFGSELHEHLGAFQQALAWQKKYNALKDSLFDAASISDIQELELKYQTTLTQKTLAEQQLVIARHENAIERKNRIIVLVVSAILILTTVVAIVMILHFARRRTIRNAQRLKLLQAQLMGEEKERARQAKELHDGVSGLLAAARIHLAAITTSDDNKHVFDKVMALLHRANNEVRNISHNLAPEIVLEHGLHHAIEDYVSRVSNAQLDIQLSVIGAIPRMKIAFELLIYRAVQESLNNVIKHAKATTAMVQLTCLESLLTITIEDNGIGFDTASAPAAGLGLSNLASRIHGVQGIFDVTSSPGNGTTIYIEVDVTKFVETTPASVLPPAVPVPSN